MQLATKIEPRLNNVQSKFLGTLKVYGSISQLYQFSVLIFLFSNTSLTKPE